MTLQPRVSAVESTECPRLVEIWEAAVRATHHFLSEADLAVFRPLVAEAFLPAVSLACVRDEQGGIVGFVGIVGRKIEMLFVDPAWHGHGAGRQLVEYAVQQQGARGVDVNEQNTHAVAFYRHLGFEVRGRSEHDGMGKPFPLLHMSMGS